MNRKFLPIAILLLLSLSALFAQRTTPDNSIVGASEVIVAGTVTSITDSPLIGGGMNGGSGPGGATNGQWGKMDGVMKNITFTVEETLLGEITTKEITVSVPTYANQKTEWLPKAGDVKLFCLQRSRDGYALTYGQTGIQSIDKIEELEKIVKAVPVSLTLSLSEKPLYFAQMTPITITVTNLTDAPLTLRNFNLGGFFHAKRMESFISFISTLVIEPATEVAAAPQVTLAAKEKKLLTLLVSPRQPQSMALLGDDSYMITAAAIYAQLAYSVDNTNWLGIRSNWQDAYIGFGLQPVVEAAPMGD